ncbi:MAG: class I tRNA ligase family protein [Candidatus Nasuia deltocephalinicola]
MFLKFRNCVSMIPYPSGVIHIGHCRNYIIGDISNRFFNFKNYLNKVYMGWDCFGTPAENLSIIKSITPLKLLNKNIFYMKNQLKYINLSLNYKNNFKTFKFCYYYFNQLFFYKFVKYKIIYISNKVINWDDCDKTVLSNEQTINGKGWRSDCFVKKKNILTYYLNLNLYRGELFKEIYNLNWPEKIKLMQKKWIFKKNFFFIFYFFIFFFSFLKKKNIKNFLFFFLNFYISFNFFKIIIFLNIIKKNKFNFLKSFFILNKGLSFKNFLCKSFENWFTKKIFNYKKNFYIFFFLKKIFNFVYFSFFSYFSLFEFYYFFKKRKTVFFEDIWNVKDWGISRQRYWGTPIPLFFCKNCKKFYSIKYFKFILISKNLKKNKLFYLKNINKIKCFLCKNKSFKEINTMDTFVDSSWYFLKYLKNRKFMNYNMPIDKYIGGIEHSILHLFYSRYIIKFLRDIKYLIFGEPFKKVFCQGMILYKTFYNKNFFRIEKMSKSKNNIINPERISLDFNVDSFRISILKNSLNKDFLWSENLVIFGNTFLKKLFVFLKNIIFFKKELFLRKMFSNNNFKHFLFFFNKNLKKIYFFLKNSNYNNSLLFLIKIFNCLKKNLKKGIYFNLFFFKNFLFKILEVFYFFSPIISLKLLNIFFSFKIKKYCLKKVFKVILKKYIKFILLLKNKNLGNIFFFVKFLKKKIFNFLFFKKKIKKKSIKKIIKIKKFFNIFVNI